MDTTRDFMLEKKLRALNPGLHELYTDSVVSLTRALSNYKSVFPEYTDHSETHSLAVIEFCNEIIRSEDAEELNGDELYILLMGAFLHDVGMGLTIDDFLEYSSQVEYGDFFEVHPHADTKDVVRQFHNDFSALFILKHAMLFDFPSKKHAFAVAQVAKGHRKVDLYDEDEFPEKLVLDNGNTVSLPYLAALLRLADEMDVAEDRNPEILFDLSSIKSERQQMEFARHKAVKHLEITDDAFVMIVDPSVEAVFREVVVLSIKMQSTLDYCRAVVNDRTPYKINQSHVQIKRIDDIIDPN